MLYELATGRDRQDFPRLPADLGEREDRPELLELNEIIVKASAPHPNDRYDDAETLLAELQLLEAGKSGRRLRFAEAGLARARKWIALAATVAAIAGTGVYLERQRANTESASRRAAEAELAALTRRSLYASSIVTAQRALENESIPDARLALNLAIPRPGEPDLRGFEWYALSQESVDTSDQIHPRGRAPRKIHPAKSRWSLPAGQGHQPAGVRFRRGHQYRSTHVLRHPPPDRIHTGRNSHCWHHPGLRTGNLVLRRWHPGPST
ncbi:MAG: hypothetical protein J6386_16380 [Candidatus Synoicihabitans palmerolidicus]|nr:hypothetical protein [Candidatus Synoicihabitans palmerolidicus]